MEKEYRISPVVSQETELDKFSMDLDAIIVHGKNWRKYPLKLRIKNLVKQKLKNAPPLPLQSSLDSKFAGIAAAEAYLALKKKGKPPVLIFSTGFTRGENNPSEAEAIVSFMKNLYPEIPDEDIVIEDISHDTVTNIEESKRIIEEAGYKKVGYMTTSYHIPRVQILMNYYNAPISIIFPTDQLAKSRSPHHAALVDRYRASEEWAMHVRGEKALIAETIFDPGQRFLSATLAKLIRHQ